jgi:hypothetical protein
MPLTAFPTGKAISVRGYTRMLSSFGILQSMYLDFYVRWLEKYGSSETCPSFEEVVEHLLELRRELGVGSKSPTSRKGRRD